MSNSDQVELDINNALSPERRHGINSSSSVFNGENTAESISLNLGKGDGVILATSP